MKLYFYGHDYKYAVEQMLLTLFPQERPEYPQGRPQGDRMEVKLSKGEKFTTASCKLCIDGEIYHGRGSVGNALCTDELETVRQSQHIIKDAIYRAAVASGLQRPVWGSLTGVRPGKLMSPYLEQGMSDKEALKEFMSEYDVSSERAKLCLDTSKETVKLEKELGEKDVCLYIGIPFCPTRCAYCSFVSQSVEKSMKLIAPFFEALKKEVRAVAEQVNKLGLRVISVYMGGGTPTTLSAPQIDELCCLLEECFDLSELREYTVEAGRPDTITKAKLEALKAHGIDRVSVNPQTMSDKVLNTIGRRHSAQDIVDALELVRETGDFAVNMDLIAGLPDDTVESFNVTIDKVLALEPENITVHTLALKKGSRLMLEGSDIPGAAEVGKMLSIAMEKLRAADYEPYYLYRQKFMSGGFENVGWAKKGYNNIYNICIMEELCSIIAMGGGGSTKLIRHDGGMNIRLTAPKYPQEYISGIDKTCRDKEKIAEFYSYIKYKEE